MAWMILTKDQQINPMIYLKRGNDSLRSIIGIGVKEKYAPLLSFFDTEGNYKIANDVAIDQMRYYAARY